MFFKWINFELLCCYDTSLENFFELMFLTFFFGGARARKGEWSKGCMGWLQKVCGRMWCEGAGGACKCQNNKYMGVSWNGGTSKSSILIGCFLINHRFWRYPHVRKPWNFINTTLWCILRQKHATCSSELYRAFRSRILRCITALSNLYRRALQSRQHRYRYYSIWKPWKKRENKCEKATKTLTDCLLGPPAFLPYRVLVISCIIKWTVSFE